MYEPDQRPSAAPAAGAAPTTGAPAAPGSEAPPATDGGGGNSGGETPTEPAPRHRSALTFVGNGASFVAKTDGAGQTRTMLSIS